MDAIVLLKQDHGNVEGLFERFEHLDPEDLGQRATIRDHVLEQLAVHAAIEEQFFYPAIRERVPDARALTLESLEEHHLVKLALAELEKLDPAHERFDAKMTVLIENVRHHVQEEEDDLFPKVREAFTNEELEQIGEAMATGKTVSPKRSHPLIPDTPPFNLLLGPPVAAFDAFVNAGRDAVSQLRKPSGKKPEQRAS